MWNSLQTLYEGTREVKDSKVSMLKLHKTYSSTPHAQRYNKVAIELYVLPKERETIDKTRGKRKRVRKLVMRGECISISHICYI